MRDDVLLKVLLPDVSLRASVVSCVGVCREAKAKHQLREVAAQLLAQGIVGATLMAGALKGDGRVNLQVECDGPVRGLLVDAGADGSVRGYVKNPLVDVELAEGPFQWRAALGNSGFLSVLRPQPDGEYYRSSVELTELDLEKDLFHYFATSDQVASRVALAVRRGDDGVGTATGVLIQALPGGDADALAALGLGLPAMLQAHAAEAPMALASRLFMGHAMTVMGETPLVWRCTCSKLKVVELLRSMGLTELRDMLETQGAAKVTCHFCGTRHEVSGTEIKGLIAEYVTRPPS